LAFRRQGKVVFRAVTDAFRELPIILAKRKKIQNNIKVNSFQLLQIISTGLFDPYLEFIRRNKAE
jgi:hypothetical protein